MAPGVFIGLNCLEDVRFYFEIFFREIGKGSHDVVHNLAILDQSAQPLDIGLGIGALGLPYRKPLRNIVLVDGFHRAVNPAETERFLHGIIVRDARFSGVLFCIHKPNTLLGFVIALQPRTPFCAIVKVQQLLLGDLFRHSDPLNLPSDGKLLPAALPR